MGYGGSRCFGRCCAHCIDWTVGANTTRKHANAAHAHNCCRSRQSEPHRAKRNRSGQFACRSANQHAATQQRSNPLSHLCDRDCAYTAIAAAAPNACNADPAALCHPRPDFAATANRNPIRCVCTDGGRDSLRYARAHSAQRYPPTADSNRAANRSTNPQRHPRANSDDRADSRADARIHLDHFSSYRSARHPRALRKSYKSALKSLG